MKPEELMIGDYITFSDVQNDDSCPKLKVIALNEVDVYVSVDGDPVADLCGPEDIAGIPITPEILEKNGFEFGYTASEEDFCNAVGCGYPEEKGWCYDEGAGEIKIIFPNETDGGLIRLDDQCVDKHLELVFVKPIMVHELQHALRLCGIEKEIIL